MNYYITSNSSFVSQDELYHHGIKGQHWGVRRYQNADGSLTAAGKTRQHKMVASNRNATITKGTKLYRISSNDGSDASNEKMYVSATKESGDFYTTNLGKSKIYNSGKIFVQEYMAKTDLKMPDRKTMEKIELGLLKDKAVQKELVDSLMKKGVSREQATEQVRQYNAGKAFVQKVASAFSGAYLGAVSGSMPGGMIGSLPVAAIGAGVGAAGGAVALASIPSEERYRALNVARVSYGDVNNKITNSKLQKALADKGYNAMKDYNDRRAYGKNGEQAIIVFDSAKNAGFIKSTKLSANEYGKAYARNYLKEHPKSKLDFGDLVKDGEKEYRQLYESGVIDRARKEENKRLLKSASENSIK